MKMEVRCLRDVAGVAKFDKIKSRRISERTGVRFGLGERVEQTNLR